MNNVSLPSMPVFPTHAGSWAFLDVQGQSDGERGEVKSRLFIHSKRTTFLTSNPRRLGKGAAMGFKWFATIKMIPLPS